MAALTLIPGNLRAFQMMAVLSTLQVARSKTSTAHYEYYFI